MTQSGQLDERALAKTVLRATLCQIFRLDRPSPRDPDELDDPGLCSGALGTVPDASRRTCKAQEVLHPDTGAWGLMIGEMTAHDDLL